GVGDTAQELGVAGYQMVQRPGQRRRLLWQAGERAAIVVEAVEAALEAVVEDADQRVVAEADGVVTSTAQQLCQMRQVWRQRLVGLQHLVGRRIAPGEHRSVAGNRPLGGRYSLLEHGSFLSP